VLEFSLLPGMGMRVWGAIATQRQPAENTPRNMADGDDDDDDDDDDESQAPRGVGGGRRGRQERVSALQLQHG